jgi:UDP-N-acetylmuramyl tripeptide synthase
VSIFPDPRLCAAILAARSAQFASRRLGTGGGSTIPGVVARRVDPGVLNKLSRQLPLGSAAITGTNGKTTTTGMISKILATAGVRAVNNSTGREPRDGRYRALVSDSSLSGKPSSEMGLFEVDEASVPRVAAEAELKILAVLNLFRDQLDRYGELAYTGKVIASAFSDLPRDGAVVLNADDPLVASLGRSAARPVFYGVDAPTSTPEPPARRRLEGLPGLRHPPRLLGGLHGPRRRLPLPQRGLRAPRSGVPGEPGPARGRPRLVLSPLDAERRDGREDRAARSLQRLQRPGSRRRGRGDWGGARGDLAGPEGVRGCVREGGAREGGRSGGLPAPHQEPRRASTRSCAPSSPAPTPKTSS